MHYLNASAGAQLAALRNGAISAAELLEQIIDRSEQLASTLNPFAVTMYARAREAARIADQKLVAGEGGRLCGLPVSVKDSQFLAGYPCANGSQLLRDFVPHETSAAIKNLQQEDAIIFAKTTCPEFSLSGITHSDYYGLTSNPWNLEHTCGGSSGGAAAAVAAGLGACALGGDGGGSIRIPAGFCGVVGFKPSFAAIPREPCFPSWRSLVSYGPMTRCVDDALLLFEILSGSPAPDGAATDIDQPLLYSEDLGFAPVDACVRDAFRELIARLRQNGFNLREDHPGLSSSVVTWVVIASYDAAEHTRASDYDADYLGTVAKGFIEFGEQFGIADFAAAEAHRNVIRRHYQDLFKRHDAKVLITPTLGCEAFRHGSIHPPKIEHTAIEVPWLDWAGFLYDANLAGLPACAIPMGIGDQGLPLSLQILGQPGSDYEVLRVAKAIEATIAWDNSIVTPRRAPVEQRA